MGGRAISRLGIGTFVLAVVSVPAVAAPAECFRLDTSEATIKITPSRLVVDLFRAPVAEDFPLINETSYYADVELVSKGRSRKVVARMAVAPANPQTSSPRRIVIFFGGEALDANVMQLIVCDAKPAPSW